MRKTTTRFMAMAMAAMMAASMVGCNTTTADNKAEATTQAATLVNPVKEVTEDEMVELTGIDLPAPDGATDVSYSVIDEGDDGMIAQMDFTYDGNKMYLRACSTGLTEFNPTGDAENGVSVEGADISGLNYKWTAGGTELVQNRDAFFNISKEGAGYIAWLDVVPGILYNLGMTENADQDKLVEYAEAVFVPLQGEVDGDEVAEGDIQADFDQLLEDIYATKAGSAGSSARVEAAAEELRTFVQNYAADITEQNMEALAEEKLSAMNEEYGDGFVDNFGEELDAVVESAMSADEELETDVAFNQLANALTNQLEILQ